MKLTEEVTKTFTTNLTIKPIQGCRGICVWEGRPTENSKVSVYVVKDNDFQLIGIVWDSQSLRDLEDRARRESE